MLTKNAKKRRRDGSDGSILINTGKKSQENRPHCSVSLKYHIDDNKDFKYD